MGERKEKKKKEKERGKYQCHIAASCTYRVPIIISLTIQRSLYLNEQIWRFAGKLAEEKEKEEG